MVRTKKLRTLKKRYKKAIFIGVMSFLIQVFDRLFVSNVLNIPSTGLVFVSFIAWGSYTLIDIDQQKISKLYSNFAIGFLIAYIMIVFGSWLSFAKSFTSPLVALIVVPAVMLMDALPKGYNLISIYFIGSGVFFGLTNYLGFGFYRTFVIASIYIVVGFLAAKISNVYTERI